MKKICFLLVLSCFAQMASSQAYTSLNRRLKGFMDVNSKMDLNKVLDYTYPKLFTIVPKEQILEVMKQSFDNGEMTIQLDSLKADKVYPVFETKQGSYAKILYSMKMTMHLKNKPGDDNTKEKADTLFLVMKSQMGADKVSRDVAGNTVVRTSAVMVAAKDIYADDWCFVNLKEGDPITTQLFSKEIIDKLATYK